MTSSVQNARTRNNDLRGNNNNTENFYFVTRLRKNNVSRFLVEVLNFWSKNDVLQFSHYVVRFVQEERYQQFQCTHDHDLHDNESVSGIDSELLWLRF